MRAAGPIPLSAPLPPDCNLEIEVWHMDGPQPMLIQRLAGHNIVPLTGRNLARDLLYWASTADGTRPSGINVFAIGTSTGAFSASSTSLGAEVYRDTSFTQRTKTDGQTVYKYFLGVGTTASAFNGVTLTEAALYANGASTAANNGTPYALSLYTGIAKTTSLGITFNWTATWADDGV